MCFCVSFLICTKKETKFIQLCKALGRYFDKLCYSNTAFSKVTLLCTAKAYLNKLIFNFVFGFTNMITRHFIPASLYLWKIQPAHQHTAGDSFTRQEPQAQQWPSEVLLPNLVRARCDSQIMSSALQKAGSMPAKLHRTTPQQTHCEDCSLSSFQILSP